MIKKPVWIWKGVPSDFKEFFREVFVSWLETAFIFGLIIGMIIFSFMFVVAILCLWLQT